MKAEYGKYYLLDRNKEYFSVDLHRQVKFSYFQTLAVKCSSGFGDTGHFGTLVDTSNKLGPDYDTNNEIEFSDCDVVGIYQPKDMPIYYSDFNSKNSKD